MIDFLLFFQVYRLLQQSSQSQGGPKEALANESPVSSSFTRELAFKSWKQPLI